MNANMNPGNSREFRAKLQNLKGEMEAKRDLMDNLAAAIKEFKNSNKKIGTIITEISDTAFQGKLLGLNAAVEAAKAGETGRDLAAAAAEVGSQAKKITELSKKIKDIISENDQSRKNAAALAGEAADFFTEIKKTIDEINLKLDI